VHLEASYGRQYDASVGLAEQDTASVTGRVTVPLYEGGEVYARVRQAAHTHVSRLQEIEQARVETQAAIRTAWSRLMAARAQLKSDEVQVEANRIALEGVREEERVGQRTLLDVLNAEQEYLDAQVAMTTTRHDLVVANYALLAAMGQLTAETLGLGDHIYDPEQHYQEVRQQWFGLSIEHADGRRELIRAADADESLEPNE
jgi:outer membrane protein